MRQTPDSSPIRSRPSFHARAAVARLALALGLAAWLAACRGQSAPLQPAGEGATGAEEAGEEGGTGPQILTADLVQRQEVHTDKFVVRWSIIGSSAIRSVTINGEPQSFPPGDTLQLTKELTLTVAQTVIRVVATDAKGEKRTRAYLIVNPDLPVKAVEVTPSASAKIAETHEGQQKQEEEIEQQEGQLNAKYRDSEYSAWFNLRDLKQEYYLEVRRGRYPVWIQSRQIDKGGDAEFRAVFKPLPTDIVTHRAYLGLTPHAYNGVAEQLTARGYQQLFRAIYRPRGGQWMIQTVWVLKAGGR